MATSLKHAYAILTNNAITNMTYNFPTKGSPGIRDSIRCYIIVGAARISLLKVVPGSGTPFSRGRPISETIARPAYYRRRGSARHRAIARHNTVISRALEPASASENIIFHFESNYHLSNALIYSRNDQQTREIHSSAGAITVN